ncbi:MAG: oligosaccharide flippase family protein [Elusimicrobia bacterium]|nr:oligosaccharide flippase family protein [Elusimicrobiota bacterium]
MFGELKRLGRETMVYGLSTVVGRLLNFLLLPLYTHCLSPADYGVVATVFTYIAICNILYSHGMDFAFMRFSRNGKDTGDFSTPFWSMLATSLAFSGAIHLCARPLAVLALVPPELSDIIRYSAWIMALDALCLVPFAELRLTHKPAAYAGIKVANIVLNIALNYVFLVRVPMGIRGVFLASLITAAATFVMVAPVLWMRLEARFDRSLYPQLLRFALPLIPAGLAAMMVQVIDRPILQRLTDDAAVGIYQANYRLGIFMMMVVNMFDAAWRPFFIQRAAEPGHKEIFARVMTYFVVTASLLFLVVTLFIPDIAAVNILRGKPLIHPAYWAGLGIVPVVTLGYLFHGIHVNLLAPVTLAKRTDLVACATGIGAAVSILSNLLLIPRWGLMGAASATLLSYVSMSAALFLMARRVYPVSYEYRRLGHLAACLVLSVFAFWTWGRPIAPFEHVPLRLALLASFPALLLLTGFFDAEELSELKSVLGRLRGRS